MSSLEDKSGDRGPTLAEVTQQYRQYQAEITERYGEIGRDPNLSLAECVAARIIVQHLRD